MFKITRKQKRNDQSIAFFDPKNSMSEEVRNHIQQNYILTGKLLLSEDELSQDGLTLTTVIFWDSESSAREFGNDPVVSENLFKSGKSFTSDNNIELSITEEVL